MPASAATTTAAPAFNRQLEVVEIASMLTLQAPSADDPFDLLEAWGRDIALFFTCLHTEDHNKVLLTVKFRLPTSSGPSKTSWTCVGIFLGCLGAAAGFRSLSRLRQHHCGHLSLSLAPSSRHLPLRDPRLCLSLPTSTKSR
ncbi:uncharacterized protein BJ212DRAFT_1347447 [Suillus subaureus]|uniref:Uncharacterized protein n=1 Tax=Suillus subaureus TaxID=48587 RepID=A0A9P7EDM4_9AGAM|nr:uncharacterized protein BJ212DRAFT_1347447 [Suillus subaureus]KAG1818756.1 hypothetical protein BJ212DRAFT_1347447 [Suillus subaureus]